MGLIRPATPGFLITLVATILLLVVSFSVPWFKSVFFLKAAISQNNQSGFITFGVLGYCTSINNAALNCTKAHVGYQFDPNALLGGNIKFLQIPSVVTKWVTWALVLHIVAFGLAAVSALFGLLAHVRELSMTCFSSCISGFAAAVALLAFVFDLVLFFTARSRINSVQGGSATIGSGIWLTLAAWVLLFFSGCFYSLGRCCLSRRPRAPGGNWKAPPPGAPLENGQKDTYAEAMRLDAIKAETDRKARQATTERGLPAFAGTDESKPLASNYEATYVEDEQLASPYRDRHPVGIGRIGGPNTPHRTPTSHSGAPSSNEDGYGAAAYNTGYTPGSTGSRAIDNRSPNAPGAQSPYATPTASRLTQRQPSDPTSYPIPSAANMAYPPSQHRQPTLPGGYPIQGDSHPTYSSPAPMEYYNQQPYESGGFATGAAAAAAGGYAAYQLHDNQQQYGEARHEDAYGYGHGQYLSSNQYGHTQDHTSYHTAASHPQEHSYYSPQAENQINNNPAPLTDAYGLPISQSPSRPSPPGIAVTRSESSQYPHAAAYASSSVLPMNVGGQSPSNTPYYTTNTHIDSLVPQPNAPRPESTATSYFPYDTQGAMQPGGNGRSQVSPSAGGLHPVKEGSGSSAENPPEYSQGGYAGGWSKKS